MTHIKDMGAKPEPLAAGTPTPDDALREARADAKHWQAQFEAAHWERAEIRQALDAARAETEAVRRERDALKQQAQIWAQEARAQRATVREAYQACTGATGEPGDWHGAEPVRSVAAERDALRALAAELVEGLAAVDAKLSGAPSLVSAADWIETARRMIAGYLARARAQGIGGEREKGGND